MNGFFKMNGFFNRRAWASDAGSALVELAVSLPLLVLVMVGTIDFARVFYTGMELTNAARAGAQYGAYNPAQSGDIAGMQTTAAGSVNITGVDADGIAHLSLRDQCGDVFCSDLQHHLPQRAASGGHRDGDHFQGLHNGGGIVSGHSEYRQSGSRSNAPRPQLGTNEANDGMEAPNSHLPEAGRRRRMGDDRGENLVEFALASTVFFMTLFGIIIFGIGVWRYNMVSDLAQEGARWASVHGSTSRRRRSKPTCRRTSRAAHLSP